jgi:hypothetical protein
MTVNKGKARDAARTTHSLTAELASSPPLAPGKRTGEVQGGSPLNTEVLRSSRSFSLYETIYVGKIHIGQLRM